MSLAAEEIFRIEKLKLSKKEKELDLIIQEISRRISLCKKIPAFEQFSEEFKDIQNKLQASFNNLKDIYNKHLDINNIEEEIQSQREISIFEENKFNELKKEYYNLQYHLIDEEKNLYNKNIVNSFNSIDELIQSVINSNIDIYEKDYIIQNINSNKFLYENKTIEEAKNMIFNPNKEEIISEKIYNDYKKTVDDEFNLLTKEKINHEELIVNASNQVDRIMVVSKVTKAIRDIGYIVKKENVKLDIQNDIVYILGEKNDGKTVQFQIKINGKYIYNYEGFDGHDHDVDLKLFQDKIKLLGLYTTDNFKKIYREPNKNDQSVSNREIKKEGKK